MPDSGANARSSKAHERNATEFQEPDVNQSPGSPSATGPRLTRRSHNKLIAGVASGIGDHSAIEMIGERLPDVVLVDVHMPSGGGEAVIRGVLAEHPEVKFLALSVSDAPEDVIAVIRAGARGYVTKTISGAELARRDPSRRRRRRRVLAPPRRLRARRVLASADGSRRSRSRPAHRARARGAAPHRARVRVQGDRAASSTSRPRRSRPTCRRCCASSSSRTVTSSPAGPPSAASSDAQIPAGRPRRVLDLDNAGVREGDGGESTHRRFLAGRPRDARPCEGGRPDRWRAADRDRAGRSARAEDVPQVLAHHRDPDRVGEQVADVGDGDDARRRGEAPARRPDLEVSPGVHRQEGGDHDPPGALAHVGAAAAGLRGRSRREPRGVRAAHRDGDRRREPAGDRVPLHERRVRDRRAHHREGDGHVVRSGVRRSHRADRRHEQHRVRARQGHAPRSRELRDLDPRRLRQLREDARRRRHWSGAGACSARRRCTRSSATR